MNVTHFIQYFIDWKTDKFDPENLLFSITLKILYLGKSGLTFLNLIVWEHFTFFCVFFVIPVSKNVKHSFGGIFYLHVKIN